MSFNSLTGPIFDVYFDKETKSIEKRQLYVFLFISITLISIMRVGFLLENNGSIVIEQ